MNSRETKLRLLKLNQKQIDLLREIRKRGYPKLAQPTLSSYISGALVTPQAEAVLRLCEQILKEWESDKTTKS